MKEIDRDALLVAAVVVGYILGKRSMTQKIIVQYIKK